MILILDYIRLESLVKGLSDIIILILDYIGLDSLM